MTLQYSLLNFLAFEIFKIYIVCIQTKFLKSKGEAKEGKKNSISDVKFF